MKYYKVFNTTRFKMTFQISTKYTNTLKTFQNLNLNTPKF